MATQGTMQQCQAEACSITLSRRTIQNTLIINLKSGNGISATTAQTASAAPTAPAGPLPPQGWRLNSKTCVHCPLPVPTRIHNKRTGTKTGAVCHAVARSSVEPPLRCVRIMHLVCCVGESVCATPHLLPCCCGVRNTRCTPTRRKPEMQPSASEGDECVQMFLTFSCGTRGEPV